MVKEIWLLNSHFHPPLIRVEHIYFILYGLISDVLNGNAKTIEVTTLDLEKAFDKINLKYTLSDMHDILPREKANDKVALLYKVNENTNVAVKTPFGLTERMKKNNN